MRIFDAHIHFCKNEEQYEGTVNELLKYADNNNVIKMGIIGWENENYLVEKAINEYPNKFIGYAWVNLDEDNPEIIEKYYKKGFHALKVILTEKNYDDTLYYPFYKKAEELGLPILFHTGVIGGSYDYLIDEESAFDDNDDNNDTEKFKGKSSARMRSIYLDTIANTFPELKIIGAHLGWPEYMNSCAIARWRKNLYFDISGGEVVRRHILEGNYIGKEISPSKLIFGSDSSLDKMPKEISAWNGALKSIGLSSEERDKIFYLNAARIFELEDL